jgi:hypothetical protein
MVPYILQALLNDVGQPGSAPEKLTVEQQLLALDPAARKGKNLAM